MMLLGFKCYWISVGEQWGRLCGLCYSVIVLLGQKSLLVSDVLICTGIHAASKTSLFAVWSQAQSCWDTDDGFIAYCGSLKRDVFKGQEDIFKSNYRLDLFKANLKRYCIVFVIYE